jgi:hypothetical protein
MLEGKPNWKHFCAVFIHWLRYVQSRTLQLNMINMFNVFNVTTSNSP